MRKYTIMITAALLIASTSVQAEEMGHYSGKHGMLKQADTNHDGVITKTEFVAAATRRAEKHFSRMDVNGDGVLNDKDHQAHFDKMDTNHDGMISRDEFDAFHRQMRSRHHKRKGEHHE